MSHIRIYILYCAAAFLAGCQPRTADTEGIAAAQTISLATTKGTVADKDDNIQLFPIDREDERYDDGDKCPLDTVTASGWTIQYLVRNDASKYKDLYIVCSKGNSKAVILSDFTNWKHIPVYAGENKSHIFFEHYCGFSCLSVTTVTKATKPADKRYEQVLDYDISSGQLVYNVSGNDPDDSVKVTAVDLSSKKQQLVAFNNLRPWQSLNAGVDSIVFKNGSIQLFAGLVDRNDPDEEDIVKESRVVSFDN
ncbi:hypothetical protein [Chitinophaga rhizophila]|uniref:Uncharacterized protein n=1 Tax=Chitinophaga rhizophila TaxID=2866212 RepID=A0ABS7G8S2_9BACT|nr:hypothetical protein [Chitinophaga rhizophila]MBW8683189.1 hypothetical protein [Chitinophaga rhizophila]